MAGPDRRIAVPRPTETEGYPIVDLLVDSVHGAIHFDEVDVEVVRQQLLDFLEGDEPLWRFTNLFGDSSYLTRYAAERVIAIVQSYARHVPVKRRTGLEVAEIDASALLGARRPG